MYLEPKHLQCAINATVVANTQHTFLATSQNATSLLLQFSFDGYALICFSHRVELACLLARPVQGSPCVLTVYFVLSGCDMQSTCGPIFKI